MSRRLSIIVPVFNEGSAVDTAWDSIRRMCESQLAGWEFEIIFVDDGSQDHSFANIKQLCRQYANVKGIRFAANAGSHMAIRAGLEHASGDAACFLACDLQDPPEIIPAMIEKLADPVQVVWAVRNSRQDSWKTRVFSNIYQRVARRLVSENIPSGGSSMILLGPGPLKMMPQFKERNVALEGLFATMGFHHAYIPYERQARRTGKSKWTLAKKIKLFADSILSFSYVPIRLMSISGLMMATSGVVYALSVLVGKMTGWLESGIGLPALMTVLLVGQGSILIMLGILGEYLWRTFDEARGRPKYVIEEFVQSGDEGSEILTGVFTRRAA